MAKKSKIIKEEQSKSSVDDKCSLFAISKQNLDPSLTTLFSSSFGPVQTVSKVKKAGIVSKAADREVENSTESNGVQGFSDGGVKITQSDVAEEQSQRHPNGVTRHKEKASRRKRKYGDDDGGLEDTYMQKLAKEEDELRFRAEAERKAKRSKNTGNASSLKTHDSDADSASEESGTSRSSKAGTDEAEDLVLSNSEDDLNNRNVRQIPQHETLTNPTSSTDLERSFRTVFVSNISTEAITSKSSKRTLLKHFSSFLNQLPQDNNDKPTKPDASSEMAQPAHQIESIRFRSTAYSGTMPRKAAFVAKDLMSATTKSTNAYIVYSSKLAAREAARRLNGTVVLDRHVHVDEVAHPAKVDHKRCVFVGNLGYVDDESNMLAAMEKDVEVDGTQKVQPKKKARPPGDVEEGLWRQFGNAGTVESVRVVRDPKTRVGKGFAYVQFTDPNAVEAALLYNEKAFPPLLPRKIRVIRAKAIKRNKIPLSRPLSTASAPHSTSSKSAHLSSSLSMRDADDPKIRSMQGRALRTLGRAGAAQAWRGEGRFRTRPDGNRNGNGNGNGRGNSAGFVFEGIRAKKGDGIGGGGKAGKGRSGGKKRTGRSARGGGKRSERAAAWKAKGRR